MLERVLYSIIKTAIAELAEDRSILEGVLSTFAGLSTEEAAARTDVFRRRPPNVIHQYPRADSSFPLYAIVLRSERESKTFLANDIGRLSEIAGFETREAVGQIYTGVFDILVVSDSADHTLALYKVLKYVLNVKRDELGAAGALNMSLSAGDMAPSYNYLPTHLFIRRMTVTADYEEIAPMPDAGLATGIAGIHVYDGSGEAIIAKARVEVTDE